MGHSIVAYGEGSVTAKDVYFEVWGKLICRVIDGLDSKPLWILKLRDEWYEQADMAINGCINFEFDEFFEGSEDRKKIFMEVIQAAKDVLRSQGDVLRKTYLNELLEASNGNAFQKDAESATFMSFGENLLSILDGSINENLIHS